MGQRDTWRSGRICDKTSPMKSQLWNWGGGYMGNYWKILHRLCTCVNFQPKKWGRGEGIPHSFMWQEHWWSLQSCSRKPTGYTDWGGWGEKRGRPGPGGTQGRYQAAPRRDACWGLGRDQSQGPGSAFSYSAQDAISCSSGLSTSWTWTASC